MKNKKSKVKKKRINIEHFFDFAEIFLIFLLIWNTLSFYEGVHNIDLYQNLLYLSNQGVLTISTEELNDIGTDFVSRPLRDYYIAGINKIKTSLIMGSTIMFCLGIILGYRIKEREKKEHG